MSGLSAVFMAHQAYHKRSVISTLILKGLTSPLSPFSQRIAVDRFVNVDGWLLVARWFEHGNLFTAPLNNLLVRLVR